MDLNPSPSSALPGWIFVYYRKSAQDDAWTSAVKLLASTTKVHFMQLLKVVSAFKLLLG